jgi:hypothetical protein
MSIVSTIELFQVESEHLPKLIPMSQLCSKLLHKDRPQNDNKTVAEYDLRDLNKPMSISTYHLKDVLPEGLEESLPAIAQLEKV